MPEDMSDRMPADMPDRMPEDLPDRMPEDMPDHMPEDMQDRMPNRMSEDMSDRMPEDLPVRKCINVMVGITRSKVICGVSRFLFFFSQKKEICFVVWGAILQGVPLLFRSTLASKPLGSLIGVWLGSLWHFKSTQLLLWHV